MREWESSDLEKRIQEKMIGVKRDLFRSRSGKVVRRRPRDKEEQEILDLLCKRKWDNDLAKGKVKIISKREWYYEFD